MRRVLKSVAWGFSRWMLKSPRGSEIAEIEAVQTKRIESKNSTVTADM